MIEYIVLRFSSGENDTLGALYRDKEFVCFTLEDEQRAVKVAGETRIPNGKYDLAIREHGGFHARYQNKFDFHRGMIEVMDVPNFTDILIHIGNDDEDTMGCLLVGDSSYQNVTKAGFIGDSTNAYRRMYPQMVDDIIEEGATIEYMGF
tara:strand:- start:1657 stop:2103 length:447 start_codon:yes stop_codon:yes gene_type:complete